MTFAFSREPLRRLIENGPWVSGNLQETVFYILSNARRSCLELAIFLRYLDDEEGLSKSVEARVNFSFGRLICVVAQPSNSKLRDVANKIIHAAALEWDFSDAGRPKLVLCPRDREVERAEIDVVSLASVCRNLRDKAYQFNNRLEPTVTSDGPIGTRRCSPMRNGSAGRPRNWSLD